VHRPKYHTLARDRETPFTGYTSVRVVQGDAEQALLERNSASYFTEQLKVW